MPTIAAGTSPNITLTAGQQLDFSAGGAGLVTVLRVGAAAPLRSMQVGASPVNVGPFGQDHIVSVYAERALTYQVVVPNAPTLYPPLQNVAQDPTTGQQYAGGSPVSGAGNGQIAAINKIFSGAGTAISSGTTIVTQHPARRTSFTGAKLVYGNWSTAAAISISAAVAYPTATHQEAAAPTTSTSHSVGTLSGVVITGTAGQFSCTAASSLLQVGMQLPISGTAGGTGSITGYSNPTTYYVIATNGSTTFTLSATPGGVPITTTAGTPTGLTYSFAAYLPAATGSGNDIVPSLYVTGMLPITSLARTDDTTKNALLQCRTYFAAAASGISLGGTDIATFNASSAASGMQFAARTPAGDATATFTASQQPLEAGSWIVPAGVIFYYPGVRSITLASAGDSLQKGHLTTGSATGWVERMAGLLCTATVEVSPCVWAWTGQTHAASIAIARNIVATLKPTYQVFASWSPNDAAAGSHTQAIFDAGLARALDMIEFCRQNGVKPVIVTCAPWTSLTQAESDRRRALNVTLRSLSNVARIVDAATVLEDPANTKNLLAAYDTGDGLHWNDAGHAAVAVAGAAGGPLT